MENTPYMESIVASRSVLLSEQDALEGTTTISIETACAPEHTLLTYMDNNFSGFMCMVRYLSKLDQELLLSYYILAKTQHQLARVERTTQTLCCTMIAQAANRVGTFIMLGVPTPDIMHPILQRHGLEDALGAVPLSTIIGGYAQCRSYARMAQQYKLHRPDIRRVMRASVGTLQKTQDPQARALGAYINGLVERSSAGGTGSSNRQMKKHGHIHRVDPPILGQFRVQVDDPDFGHKFTGRANAR